jgi:hypothetical protein
MGGEGESGEGDSIAKGGGSADVDPLLSPVRAWGKKGKFVSTSIAVVSSSDRRSASSGASALAILFEGK